MANVFTFIMDNLNNNKKASTKTTKTKPSTLSSKISINKNTTAQSIRDNLNKSSVTSPLETSTPTSKSNYVKQNVVDVKTNKVADNLNKSSVSDPLSTSYQPTTTKKTDNNTNTNTNKKVNNNSVSNPLENSYSQQEYTISDEQAKKDRQQIVRTASNIFTKALNTANENSWNEQDQHKLDVMYNAKVDTTSVDNKIKADSSYYNNLYDSNGNFIDYDDQILELEEKKKNTFYTQEIKNYDEQIKLLKTYQQDIETLKRSANYDYLVENGASQDQLNEYKKYVIRDDYNGIERAIANFGSTIQGYVGNSLKGADTLMVLANQLVGNDDYESSEYADKIIEQAGTLQQQVFSNSSSAEKVVYELYNSQANYLYALATAYMGGQLLSGMGSLLGATSTAQNLNSTALLLSDVSVLGSAMYNNEQMGYSKEDSLNNAILKACISHFTEKIGGDNIANIVTGKIGQKMLANGVEYMKKSIINSMISEGSEEFAEALLEPIADKLTTEKGMTVEDYLEQVCSTDTVYQVFMGAVGGGIAGGVFSANTLINFNAQVNEYASKLNIDSKADYNTAKEALAKFNELIEEGEVEIDKAKAEGQDTTLDDMQLVNCVALSKAYSKAITDYEQRNPYRDLVNKESDKSKAEFSQDAMKEIINDTRPDLDNALGTIDKLNQDVKEQQLKASTLITEEAINEVANEKQNNTDITQENITPAENENIVNPSVENGVSQETLQETTPNGVMGQNEAPTTNETILNEQNIGNSQQAVNGVENVPSNSQDYLTNINGNGNNENAIENDGYSPASEGVESYTYDSLAEKYGKELIDDFIKKNGEAESYFIVNVGQEVKEPKIFSSLGEATLYKDGLLYNDVLSKKSSEKLKSGLDYSSNVQKSISEIINKVGKNKFSWQDIANNPKLVEQIDNMQNVLDGFGMSVEDYVGDLDRMKFDERIASVYYDKITKGKNKERKAFIIIGPPASGKSSVIAKYLINSTGALEIDSDAIKELFPEYVKYGGVMANYLHQESSGIADNIREEALDEGYNMVLPLVGKNATKINDIVDVLKSKGYDTIELYDVDLATEKTKARAISRFVETGRYLAPSYLESVGGKPNKTFDLLKNKEGITYYAKYDNDVKFGEKAILIENGGKSAVETTETPQINRRRNSENNGENEERPGFNTSGRNVELNSPTETSQNYRGRRNYNRANNPIDTEAQNRDGFFDYGTQPVRNVDISKGTTYGKTSQSVRTMANSQYVDDATAQQMQEETLRGEYAYEQTTNKGDTEEAIKTIKQLGKAKSIERILTDNDITHMNINIAMAREMENQLLKEGDTETAFKIRKRLTHIAAMSGQNVQAYSTFKTLTPQDQILTIKDEVDRIQEGLNERYGDRAPKITLDESLIKEYLDSETEEKRNEVADRIAQSIADQIPPTIAERLNAWRHLSMLFNPRTWIKNSASNFAWGLVSGGKQGVQTIIESMIAKKFGDTKGERMAGFVNPLSQEYRTLKKTLDADYESNYKNFQGKYSKSDLVDVFGTGEFAEQVSKYRKSFKSDFLNGVENLNSKMMSDAPAMKNAYAYTIAGYLKTNNKTWESLTDTQRSNLREYAFNKAREITFNQDSELANAIGKLANTNMGTKLLVDSFIPFKRTPINILKQGLKYSPMNLAKSISYNVYLLNKGKITGTQFADDLASGLTGTVIVLLGVLLSNLGIFRTNDDDSKRKKYFDQGNGEQDFAIVTDKGTYTIDWLDPFIMPLSIGAELASNGGITSVEDIINIAAAIGDPIFETSMLSGITKNLQGYESGLAYAGGLLKNAVSNYVSQYVPTVLGATARTLDGTRRTTYPNEGFIDKTVKTTLSKIPGLSTLNEPYINKQGEEEKTEDLGMGVLGRAVLNFLSPGYYSSKEIDEYDEELYRLYDSTGNISVIPSNTTTSVDYDGSTYKLSDKEYTQWNKTRLSNETDYVNEFIDSKEYNNYDDSQKAKIIGKLRSYAGDVAKNELLQNKGVEFDDAEYKNTTGALDSGLDLYQYFVSTDTYTNLKGDDKKSDYISYLNELDTDSKGKNYLYDKYYGESNITSNINDLGLNEDETYAAKIASNQQSLKDEDGNTIANSKAVAVAHAYEEAGVLDDVFAYIEKNGLEPKDFGLTKTVYGYSSEELENAYQSLYGENANLSSNKGKSSSGSKKTTTTKSVTGSKVSGSTSTTKSKTNYSTTNDYDNAYSSIMSSVKSGGKKNYGQSSSKSSGGSETTCPNCGSVVVPINGRCPRCGASL